MTIANLHRMSEKERKAVLGIEDEKPKKKGDKK